MPEEPSVQTTSRAKSLKNRPLIVRLMAKINDGLEQETLADCEALGDEPDHPVALYGLAVLAHQHGHIQMAFDALSRAHERDPHEPLYTEMLAVLYAMAGNLQDAVYYAKLSTSQGIDETTVTLLPRSLPSFTQCLATIQTKPLLNSAEALAAARLHSAAVNLYERHLIFFPNDAPAIHGLARCRLAIGQPGPALSCLAGQLNYGEAGATALSLLGASWAALGDATTADTYLRQARELAPDDTDIACIHLRNAVFEPGISEDQLTELNTIWGHTLPTKEAPTAEPVSRHLAVGYLVSATRDPRDISVMKAVVEALDLQRFKPTIYGYRPVDDPLNAELRHCAASHWRDISECDPFTLAAIINGDGIDVLVDIGGLGAPAHLAALALRPAPHQISWLGNPGRLGLPQIDADLVDEHELSDENKAITGRHTLSHGLYCSTAAPPVQRRTMARLNNITFGADVGIPQLHPDLLSAWARILEGVPGAMLVLRDRDFLAGGLIEPLSARFQSAGIMDRIDIITAEPNIFYSQVDIVLAPFVEINPHETIAARTQGTPVIALAEKDRHRRQSAALLCRNGLDDFVAKNEKDYVALALRLGRSAEAWNAATTAVTKALANAPLFQPAKVAAGFAAAIQDLASQRK